jgi:hypothetical protein
MSKAIPKYLEKYCEKDIHHLTVPANSFEQALVIPAYDEDTAFIESTRIKENPNVLGIIVVNKPDNASIKSAHKTFELLHNLKKINSPNLLIIDRVNNPINSRQGVGLARKIGTDLAVKMYAAQQIKSPWIRQTDADATLDTQYFKTSMPTEGAVIYQHKHQTTDPKISTAIALYDAHMSYYVSALKAQGSPYAFPTLGSTIAIHAATYAQVRGYPKRNAGEDFHLLNKVAKTKSVHYSHDSTVILEARISDRVPFGTGPSIRNILEILKDDSLGKDYLSYDFRVFLLLGTALKQLAQLARTPTTIEPIISGLLDELGFAKIAKVLHIKYHSVDQRQEILKQWFDGLKTLRFINAAQKIYPKQPLLMSLRNLPPIVRNEILHNNAVLKNLLDEHRL